MVTGERIERRLAAILAADVAGYSRLMGADEVGTLAALKTIRRTVVDPALVLHRGRIVKTTGDGILVEFASAVDAVTCALAIQVTMAETASKITFRIGINVGDIIIDSDDIFGDGVNIAARVENECEPGDVCLSSNAFEQVRGKTHFVFDDLGERSLKNIERPVRLYAVKPTKQSGTAMTSKDVAGTSSALGSSIRPSIMVLPFQNMSGDPEQEYFADGLTESLTTDLSRFRELFVVGRNTAFTFKGKSIDLQRIGRELNVRYLLEGSVQRGGERVRINVQLIDATDGGHIWAERFDRDRGDLFAVQDEISRRIAHTLDIQVRKTELKRRELRNSTNPDSIDLMLRASADAIMGSEVNKLKARLQLLEQAVTLDPKNGSALAALARNKSILVFPGWSASPVDDLKSAWECAERALEIDQEDALAWFSKGQVFIRSRIRMLRACN